ncbi:chlorophyllase type 0-like [Capsicum galapagoense]
MIPGKYPVLLFFHGFVLKPIWYKSLLQHISSHRYIIVAPKLSSLISQSDEVKRAAKVTEWLGKGLISVLPEKVQPDLLKLAVSGHSRGGKIAFALALLHGNSTPTTLKFQALVGIDPVAGSSPSCLSAPKILKYIPQSFDQSIPVAVIGSGLGNQRAHCIFPPFGPNGVNHSEFFNESKPPCYYLVSKSGKGSKELLRKAVGGIVVAFLEAKLGGQVDFLNDIVKTPSLAPITLDPVIALLNSN